MLWTKAVALEVLTKTGAGILDASIGMDEDLEHPAMFLEKRIEPFLKLPRRRMIWSWMCCRKWDH